MGRGFAEIFAQHCYLFYESEGLCNDKAVLNRLAYYYEMKVVMSSATPSPTTRCPTHWSIVVRCSVVLVSWKICATSPC